MAPQVGFEVTATNEGLLSVLAQSVAAIKGAAADAAGAFAPVTAAFEAIKGAAAGLAAVGAVLLGIKEAVSSTAELARSSIDMGVQLGVSATRASDLKVSLDSVGVSQDTLAAASQRVTRTLVSHEDAFQRLGVATRDQDGNYRSTIDIILDTNNALAGLKEGTDRNTEAQRIYGRGWMEVMPILRLTNSVMAEGKERAQALGLEVGEEQVANFIQYRGAMAQVADVFRAVWNTIGQSLMPALTALGNWFGSIGPSVVLAFQTAIATVEITFEALRFGAEVLWETLKAGFQQITVVFLSFADAVWKALHLDFSGAKQAWTEGMDQVRQIGQDYMDKMVKDAEASHEKIFNALAKPAATPIASPTGGEAPPPPQTKSRVPQWQEQLIAQEGAQAQMLAAQGQFHEVSKVEELEYWKNILATNNTSAQEKLAIGKTIGKLEVGIAQDSFNAQLAKLKEQEAQYKNNLDARLGIAQQYAVKVGAAYGTDSKQYDDAAKAVVEIERQKVAQLNAIDATRRQAAASLALAEIDSEEKSAQLSESLHHESSEQLLTQEQSFEDRRYAIKAAALQKTLELEQKDPDKNIAAIATTNAQIEQLATQHAATLQGINSKLIQEQQQGWTNLIQTIQTQFTTNISKMLEGTETFQAGIRNIFLQIGDAVIQTIVKIGVQWATTQLTNLVMTQVTARGQAQAAAALAGAQGVASFAGAPWPIDLGAPAFGASMFAEAEGFAVAERGFDVPSGMMPKTQLHSREMVLPEKYGDVIRRLEERGAGGVAGPGGGDIHLHASGIDSKSIHDMLTSPSGKKSVAKAMRSALRRR